MDNNVQKWGNSLGLRIPRALAEELGVEAGTAVSLSVKGKCLTVKVAQPKKQTVYRLSEMMKNVSAKNLHGEVQTGPVRGREAW